MSEDTTVNMSWSDADGNRHESHMVMRPPSPIQLAWYRHLGIEPPLATVDGGTADYARMVPYRYRGFHRAFARANGYFWLPCPLCDRSFGGHEWGGSIPDPTKPPADPELGPWRSIGICSECTRAGKSVDV